MDPAPPADDAGRASPRGALVEALGRVRGVVHASAVAIFVATLGALFAALFVNVVLRYLFGRGITWAYEIPSILFPWTVAASVVVATALHRNIRVRVLVVILPEAARRAVGLAVYLTVAAVSAGVLWTSLPLLRASRFMRLSETGIAQVWGVSSLVYAFGAIALIALVDFVGLLAGDRYADSVEAEASLS